MSFAEHPTMWTQTTLDVLYDDLMHVQRSGNPPDIYEFAPSEKAESWVPRDELEGWEYRVHPLSGAVDLLLTDGDEKREPMAMARRVAEWMDATRGFRWADIDYGAAPLVFEELVTEIDGIPAVGPGGRIRAVRRTHGSMIEIVVRPRINSLPSTWRSLEAIVDSVAEAQADSPRATMRFAYGYHEASSYEEQRWLRPVFVFLLEQPLREAGARWRIAMVEPATYTDELPPDAGLENVVGRCP